MTALRREDFEIMAPAGSRESLAAAAAAGADSVYFGVGALNMRSASASVFTPDDLPEIAAFCAERGMRAYLTLNSVVFDDEIALARDIIARAKAAGISAVIAADAAVMVACREAGMPVHLSTQLNVANAEALRLYAQFADVAVLARELSLDRVRVIYDAILRDDIRGPSGRPVRIEMFCHGALCMAVSGRCWLSLATRGRSANRGECLQNCRRSYVLTDPERGDELALDGGAVLSPKDLKTIEILDRMVAAGVRVFKIEGRARGPEYVRTTVECYREALEAVLEGRWSETVSRSWDERLARVFNRGFWEGWYLGRPVPELTNAAGSLATERKLYAGKCLGYFARPRVGWFKIQSETVRPGDRLVVIGPTTGAVYVEPKVLRLDDRILEAARKGDECTFEVPERIRENDRLYVLRGPDDSR